MKNLIQNKDFDFALPAIALYKELIKQKKDVKEVKRGKYPEAYTVKINNRQYAGDSLDRQKKIVSTRVGG